MSMSIGGSQVAALSSPGNTSAALVSVAAGPGGGGLIANVDAASSGVSSALQSLSSSLGSIINTSA